MWWNCYDILYFVYRYAKPEVIIDFWESMGITQGAEILEVSLITKHVIQCLIISTATFATKLNYFVGGLYIFNFVLQTLFARLYGLQRVIYKRYNVVGNGPGGFSMVMMNHIIFCLYTLG